MIAETLAGIALVKSAVEGIKSAINTAKDIGEIASHVDNLLEGEKQIQQQRSKKSGVGFGDQLGIKSVAQEVIDAKLAEEKLQEMRNLVDMRFGPGTWQSILDLRAKRIQEEKEAARLAAIKKRQEDAEFWEQMKMLAIIGIVIIIGAGAFIATLAVA